MAKEYVYRYRNAQDPEDRQSTIITQKDFPGILKDFTDKARRIDSLEIRYDEDIKVTIEAIDN